MVGLIEKPEHITTQWFKDEGDAIILLGDAVDASDPLLGLGGSAYLQRIHGLKTGTPPRCDLAKEKDLHLALARADSFRRRQKRARLQRRRPGRGAGRMLHFPTNRAAKPRASSARKWICQPLTTAKIRLDALLFGETQGRIVISVAARRR